MTDEARIARLTELARRVDQRAIIVSVTPTLSNSSHGWAALTTHNDVVLAQAMGERALDALEAALLVLAEDVTIRNVRGAVLVPMLPGEAPGDPPVWAEELIRNWTAAGEGLHAAGHDELGDAYLDCAASLRARAKRKP